MRFSVISAGLMTLLSVAEAHTLFARMYVDGEDQGDGTCLRMPRDGDTCTAPIKGLGSESMACGRDGNVPAAFVCPTPAGATLTFEFREWPDAREPGSLDKSHRGPCSVYIKQVSDMFSDEASGSGWVKIWHEGYDKDEGLWCTEKLMKNNGLLSFELPSGLPVGSYLVRPELLALHAAANKGDPQYYVGCAQIHVQDGPSGPLDIPSEYEVSIPGHVDGSESGNKFDIYAKPLALPYEIPGPKPWPLSGSSSSSSRVSRREEDFDGAIPSDCLSKNANWCGRPLDSYSKEMDCWAAVDACFKQGSECYDATSPTGVKGCDAWNKKMCHSIQDACSAGDYQGPPEVSFQMIKTPRPGDLPPAVNRNAGSISSGNQNNQEGDVQKETPVFDSPKEEPSASATPEAPEEDTSSNDDEGKDESEGEGEGEGEGEDEDEGSEPEPSPEKGSGLVVSPDGTCGGSTGYTCLDSRFGDCCSRRGRCGSRRACGCGCQAGSGRCNELTKRA